MPHILILGATGYLGQALSLRLLNTGNTLYGLARTPSKALGLAQAEITPVLGSVQAPQSITATLLAHPEISVVVDAAAVYGESVTPLHLVEAAGAERLRRFRAAGVPEAAAPKLGYVYVSGMWVHGSDKGVYASDGNPLTGDVDAETAKPVGMVAWRPEVERLVLSSETTKVLDVAVVRPGCMYGDASGIWSGPMGVIHQAAKEGAGVAKVPLEAGAVAPLIHVTDAADGIACVVEKLPVLSGTGVYPVFDVMGQVESLQAVMEGAARTLGFKGSVELVGAPEGDYLSDALGASIVADSSRLRNIVGWMGPRRKSFLQGISVYAQAWKAAFEAHK